MSDSTLVPPPKNILGRGLRVLHWEACACHDPCGCTNSMSHRSGAQGNESISLRGIYSPLEASVPYCGWTKSASSTTEMKSGKRYRVSWCLRGEIGNHSVWCLKGGEIRTFEQTLCISCGQKTKHMSIQLLVATRISRSDRWFPDLFCRSQYFSRRTPYVSHRFRCISGFCMLAEKTADLPNGVKRTVTGCLTANGDVRHECGAIQIANCV